MNFVYVALFCITFLSTPLAAHSYSFDTMMGFSASSKTNQSKMTQKDKQELIDFAKAYKSKIQLLKEPLSPHSRIPKVIHFIWLGPKEFPPESIANVRSWRKIHPGWKMRFWTDREDRPCPIEGMEKVVVSRYDFGKMAPFIRDSNNWGEISDLMRFKLLYDEGGIYADHDAECCRSFERFVSNYDLVACFERPYFWHERIQTQLPPANGVLCVAPGHPVLRETMEDVARVWEVIGKKYPGSTAKEVLCRVIQRTFDSFAQAVKPFGLRTDTRDIILPTCYFYPDKAFSKEAIQKLKKNKLVYSSHKYANAWKVPPLKK